MGTTFSPALTDRGSSSRGLSNALWQGLSTDLAGSGPSDRFFDGRDFRTLVANEYTLTQAGSSGTFDIDGTVGNIGVALLDCASSTVTQGANLQFHDMGIVANEGVTVYFESRLKAADIGTGPEFFAGLSIVDTAIIDSSANASTDHVGFDSVTDDNVLLFHTEDGGTRVSGGTSPHTLVEDTYVKLGYRINPDLTVDVYVNGTLTDVGFSSTPDIPVGTVLVPSFVNQSNGTTDPVVHLDWFYVGAKDFTF